MKSKTAVFRHKSLLKSKGKQYFSVSPFPLHDLATFSRCTSYVPRLSFPFSQFQFGQKNWERVAAVSKLNGREMRFTGNMLQHSRHRRRRRRTNETFIIATQKPLPQALGGFFWRGKRVRHWPIISLVLLRTRRLDGVLLTFRTKQELCMFFKARVQALMEFLFSMSFLIRQILQHWRFPE